MLKFLTVLILGPTLAYAIPLIYTFSGNVSETGTGVIDDRSVSGLYWSNNIQYNSLIEYRFIFDFDRLGQIIEPDGSISPTPGVDNPAYPSFYASYYSGDLFTDLFHGTYYSPGDSVGSYTGPLDPTINEFGVNLLGLNRSIVYVKPNVWSKIALRSPKYTDDWEIGDSLAFSQDIQNPLYFEHPASLSAKLVLTHIAPAVPEPSSIFMLITGAVVIFLFRRRKPA